MAKIGIGKVLATPPEQLTEHYPKKMETTKLGKDNSIVEAE